MLRHIVIQITLHKQVNQTIIIIQFTKNFFIKVSFLIHLWRIPFVVQYIFVHKPYMRKEIISLWKCVCSAVALKRWKSLLPKHILVYAKIYSSSNGNGNILNSYIRTVCLGYKQNELQNLKKKLHRKIQKQKKFLKGYEHLYVNS